MTSDLPAAGSATERRKKRRRRVLLSGLLYVPQTHSVFDCAIRDLSETGARIDIRVEALIPTDLILIDIKNATAFSARIVRRTERQAALKILRPIPLTQGAGDESRQIRRLLVERLNR